MCGVNVCGVNVGCGVNVCGVNVCDGIADCGTNDECEDFLEDIINIYYNNNIIF